ncbi:monovalent cation/H+ antiporter subunit D [Quisquiliibacterium transsilvanicum]|uniref:Multicomponent K+:H+ antiporter subunit D n=1 Tax=Quisquiliibacterium transsilvanicum TaxID=1549638 RepID=A0A7W8HGC4_9BURK|nr:monovalent cation/H+ antiporter subunit D [Quisquiliibacterium transsilvanicum]MBB5271428.1 multicomponent K+:H+ antiporter subunit D [Quisquiliibacterium transsilvanicum]
MMRWLDHLIVVPIVLPLLAGATMVLLSEHRRRTKFALSLGSALGLLAVSIALLRLADGRGADMAGATWIGGTGVYLASNWPAPFGIALAVDRLTAMMLLLTSILGLASLLFAHARWDRAGVHFHPLFQFLLMGLNGAFLTADLFNLFVFFEVMLAASYGLVLHGSGVARVRAGLHYIAVNLVASSLFLVGVSMIYAIVGTLNMAELAELLPGIPPEDRALLEAGMAILGVAFLIKSAMWPLNFWLRPAYGAASAPVAAVFSVMTKVGVYVILRLWLLLFAEGAGDSTGFGREWLLAGGMATLAVGTIGMLASQDLRRLASYSVIVSSGTLLAAIGFGSAGMVAGALYYLFSASLATAALFLLNELIERGRSFGASVLATTLEAFEAQGRLHADHDALPPEAEETGVVIPAAMAFLGLSFVCCALLITGLPPLSGFVAKFAMLSAVLAPAGIESTAQPSVDGAGWTMVTLLIVSGLAGAIALARIGIRTFWVPPVRQPPRLRLIEALPVGLLLVLTITMTIESGKVMRYLDATAAGLQEWTGYTRSVMTAAPVPGPGLLKGDTP